MPPNQTRRSRKLAFPGLEGFYYLKPLGSKDWELRKHGVLRGGGTQFTVSEGHPFRGKFEGDLGGDFFTTKSVAKTGGKRSTLEWKDGKGRPNKLDSSFYPPGIPKSTGVLTPPDPITEPYGDVNGLGATAVALVSPVNPIAELGVASAEMYRERLPSLPGIRLWKNRLNPLLGLGEEVLNAEFGWLPLVSDIEDTAEAIRKHRDILEQYKRDDGKLVRRAFHYPTETSVTEETLLPNLARAVDASGQVVSTDVGPTVAAGSVLKRTETLRKTWFAGAFTYHIPDQNDTWNGMRSIAASADKLFGIKPTPELLWELTPWSWAADWFTNTQQVVTNLSNAEIYGQVLRYGYMMDENIQRTTYTMIGSSGWYNLPLSAVTPVTYETVSKTRSRANPYGFGIGWEDLSPSQLAITAALGITRLL